MSPLAPKAVLARLQEGNRRFVASTPAEDFVGLRRLKELAEHGQNPFAAVLACSDSRIDVESVFDCGLGELFVARLAGNVVTPHTIASIEYAALNLGSALVLVLGHTGCGAIKAAVDAVGESPKHLTHSLKVLVDDIKPAVRAAKATGKVADLTRAVGRENVRLGCRALVTQSDELSSLLGEGRIAVVGAMFDLKTGLVEFGLEK